MCSSYAIDWEKEADEDYLFYNADLFEEKQEAMYETEPEDWTGYVEDVELQREDPFIGRLNEF
tara:strand:- start:2283 stop:2471 length:189 start_codon:yes stop_codon:yes gene_type:complete